MRRTKVPLSVLAAALSACVVEPELLNSERIEAQYGSYGIDVIAFSDGVRYSNLYSGEGDLKTCRTYAVVRFDEPGLDSVDAEHAAILAGGSIGATFKAHGWQVYKETRHVGTLRLPGDEHRVQAFMHIEPGAELALHVYRLLVQKSGRTVEYATIVELHHPDYLDRQALARHYLVDTPAALDRSELDELTELALRTP